MTDLDPGIGTDLIALDAGKGPDQGNEITATDHAKETGIGNVTGWLVCFILSDDSLFNAKPYDLYSFLVIVIEIVQGAVVEKGIVSVIAIAKGNAIVNIVREALTGIHSLYFPKAFS